MGNRQLLGVFFVIVFLLGIFFIMGYILGRNSSPTMVADGGGKKVDVVTASKASSTRGAPPSPAPRAGAAADNTPASETTQPARTASAIPSSERESPQTEVAGPSKQEKVSEPAPLAEPSGGQTFLQVVATARPDAELISETLVKRGFHSQLAPGPNEKLF